MSDVKNLNKDKSNDIFGCERFGYTMHVDGHLIPHVTLRKAGDHVEFILDERICYIVPKHQANLFARAIATALAIGAGYPHFAHKKTETFGTPCLGIDIEDMPHDE